MPAGYVYVDGMTVGGATEASLKDRRTLAEEGLVTIVAIVDADTGRLAEPPDFLTRGLVNSETMFAEVVPHIDKALAKAAADGIGDQHQLEQIIHRTVSRWVFKTYRRNPVIMAIVIDA